MGEETPDGGRGLRISPFLVSALLGLTMIPFALAIAGVTRVDVHNLLSFGFRDIAAGVLATLPLIALLKWLLVTDWRPLANFRAAQLEFFGSLGIPFTPGRSLVLALIAGIAEELLFRGVLQTVAERTFPVFAAILLTNAIFGALHARTLFYAILAMMIGCWLGLLFHWTGSLMAPIIAHALYDFIAFRWTQKALDQRNAAA